MIYQKKHSRKSLLYLILLAASLLIASCGPRDNPESVSDEGSGSAPSVSGGKEDTMDSFSEESESPLVPVAKFQYIKLNMESYRFDTYAFNEEWLYFVNTTMEENGGGYYTFYTSICQNRISGESRTEEFISDEDRGSLDFLALLADREGNCFTFGRRWGNDTEGIPPCFVMEKRSPDGILQWHREYVPEELDDVGEQLNQGTVAQDGRIYLYAQGAGGSVFIFSMDGALESVCTPKLDSLDGIAAGAGNSVYGYCAAGGATSFVRLDSPEEVYVCPMVPTQVFDGREDGVYLSDGKSLWSYTPESAETKKLWDWDDEYIQISAAAWAAGTSWQRLPIAGMMKNEDSVMVLCMEQQDNDSSRPPVLTFASVSFQDRTEYPKRQVITLGVPGPISYIQDNANSNLQFLIRRYNRQGKKYKIEIADNKDSSALVTKLLRREGPDLVETSFLDAKSLASAGALEDLTDYYISSDKVSSEDICPSVRNAGVIMDQNVLVVPAFYISSLAGEKKLVEPEDWTVWNFLAMGREDRMFHKQSPLTAFEYCMGIGKGEHFIDYSKMECHFDSPEFRRILEECFSWKTCNGNDPGDYMPLIINGEVIDRRILPLEEAHWLFEPNNVNNSWNDAGYLRRQVGYPGWDGAEYGLQTIDVFAINSASLNKEGAWDFLEYLLSPELQSSIDWGFSVRTDCLEAQLANNWNLKVPPSEEDMASLRSMIDSAVYTPNALTVWFILSEEAEMYFAGDATLDTTIEKIQNRVQLYLDELGE